MASIVGGAKGGCGGDGAGETDAHEEGEGEGGYEAEGAEEEKGKAAGGGRVVDEEISGAAGVRDRG